MNLWLFLLVHDYHLVSLQRCGFIFKIRRNTSQEAGNRTSTGWQNRNTRTVTFLWSLSVRANFIFVFFTLVSLSLFLFLFRPTPLPKTASAPMWQHGSLWLLYLVWTLTRFRFILSEIRAFKKLWTFEWRLARLRKLQTRIVRFQN